MTTNTNTIENRRTYYLVIYALFIALTLVATWLINIRLPFMGSGGLEHFHDEDPSIPQFTLEELTAGTV